MKNLVLLSLIIPLALGAQNTGSEGRFIPGTMTEEVMNIDNVACRAENPVWISQNPFDEIGEISAAYHGTSGQFTLPSQQGPTRGFDIDARGIKKVNTMTFQGEIAYYNDRLSQRRFNTTLYQNPLNPFILADDVPSRYDSETFHVQGAFAMDINSHWSVGINADYHVGVVSDETDPRLENRGMRFRLNPGFAWHINQRWSLGATAGINLLSETTKLSCVQTAMNYRFYLLQGLGTYYPQTGNSYTRDTKGTSWFASIDLQWRPSQYIADYLELGLQRDREHALDGGQTWQFNGGEFADDAYRLHNRLQITSRNFLHTIDIDAATHSVKGTWADQRSVVVDGTNQFVTMNKSVKQKHSLNIATVAYTFTMLDSSKLPWLDAGAKVGYEQSDIDVYPERYFRDIERLHIDAHVVKYFPIKKVNCSAKIAGGYTTALSHKALMAGFTSAAPGGGALTSSANLLTAELTVPEYQYLACDSWRLSAEIGASVPLRGRLQLGVRAGYGYSGCLSVPAYEKFPGYKNADFNQWNCAVTLQF